MDSARTADDTRRLDLLRTLALLSSDPEPALDRLSRIAAVVTGAEIAMITFIAGDRQFIRSRVGTLATEASLRESFCICTLEDPKLIEISDATQDERFADNPFVLGPRTIRSYVGVPVMFDGLVLGTVCVLDSRARTLSDDQRAILCDLGGMVESVLQSRHKQVQLNEERQHAVALAQALGESEAMLDQAQRLARLGSWELDVESGLFAWSQALYDLFDRDPRHGPITAVELRPNVSPLDSAQYDASVQRAFHRHLPTDIEFRYLPPDGRTRWISAVSAPVHDAGGRVIRLRGTMQDITERRLSEQLVRDSAERDRLLWQTTTDVVMMVSEDNLIRFCNPAILRVLGYMPDEVVGQQLTMLQPERMRAGHRQGFARYLATGERHLDWRAIEIVALHRDGREIPVEISFSDMQIDGHRIFGAFMRDVTPRIQQRQALQRSEERYRRIVQTAEEGIWMISADSVTTFVNPKMASMLGYTVDEMLGRSMYDFMDERSKVDARENVRRRELGISEQHDFRLTRKDGSDQWTAMSTSASFDDDGHYNGALAMVTDITERRRAEQALRESEERFRSLTVLSSDWYWERDEEFRLTKVVGGRAYDMNVGLGRIVGQRPWEDESALHAAEWDGHRRQLEAHEPFRDFEITHQGLDGTFHSISVSGEPVFDATGRFTGYRGVGRDMTEQRRGQTLRRELEAQLRESQKMEAIGVLAGGIAHDFNNVLAGILGNVALAIQDLPSEHAAAQSLQQIRKAGLRGRGLVQQILAFARRQPREVVSCELRPLAQECLALLRSTLPAGVTLETALSDEPLFVMADATQMEQVLMNLCTNAWHSLGGKPGRISVTLAGIDVDGAAARQLGAGLAPGAYACLTVADTGLGMDAETRARIFEPFFTTKPVGEGTGLGLAVAHGIVSAHGGVIRVQTALGEGSRFEIYLPRSVSAGVGADRPQPLAVAHRGHGENVLYIDDDDVMIIMVERLLQRLGYVVTCLPDPARAIEVVRAAPQAFDVVVTDLNMPELSGLDVARSLHRIRADLPVIISSGNLPDQLQNEARQAGVRALVHKQYTLEELGAVIHWVLAGGQRLGLEPLQMS
ncbi:MAG: PAS domain S-box protein [Burkholderiaceae bacterium]